jgi:hypothetical protein
MLRRLHKDSAVAELEAKDPDLKNNKWYGAPEGNL